MKYLLLLLFCCVAPMLVAQNWAPINTTDIYNYKADTASSISHSLWVDSFDVLAADTFMYPNKIVKHISPSLALKNQSQFLGWQVTNRNNGMMYIMVTDNSDISYYPSLTTGMIFLDARSSPVDGYVTSMDTATVLGELDSIKTIVLTTGDTIIASKNHGFVQYPMEYGTDKYYRLVGIEGGRNLGEHVPKFDDFFNYAVGDTFWYYVTGSVYGPPDTYIYEFKTAVSIDTIFNVQDTIRYHPQYKQYNQNPTGGYYYLVNKSSNDVNAMPNTLFPDTNNFELGNPLLYYYNVPVHNLTQFDRGTPLNSNACNAAGSNRYFGFSSFKNTDGSQVKVFHKWYCQSPAMGDTLNVYQSSLNPQVYPKGRVFNSLLGLTTMEMNGFESHCLSTMYAYRKAGDSTVTILDQSLFDLVIGIDELTEANFKLLGNPVTNTINLELETTGTHTLTLYNLSGQQLLQQQTETQTVSMDVAQLPQGIYLLEVRDSKGAVARQRVVKM